MKLRKRLRVFRVVVIFLSFGLVVDVYGGNVFYVATTGDDASATPTDSATPLQSLAEAVVRAVDGDEIVVDAGMYTPTNTLTVAKGVTIRSASGNPEDVKIDGGGAFRPFILNHAQAQLRDLVVQKGKADTASYTVGSNIRINSKGGIVSNCVVRGGLFATYGVRASGGGAGISCASANGLIVNCVITNNVVSGNTGYQQGGGLYMTAGTAVGCYIANNSAVQTQGSGAYGGGVHLQGTAKVVNCTIVGNKSLTGGGVDAYASTAKVINCLIWDNEGDGDMDVYLGESECFENCIARYAINDRCFAPGTSATKGAFYTPTPAYAGLDNAVAVEGMALPAVDVLGNPRVVNEKADIGAVEYQANAPEVAFSVLESSGFKPFFASFRASVCNVDGVTGYYWDFDGDGNIDETTTEPTATHEYADAGSFTPSLGVAYAGGTLDYAVPAGSIKVYPSTMYVNGANANPKQPYATEADAAKTLADALAIAADGQTIIVMKEGSPYGISKTIDVTKGVTILGETGDPEDVVIRRQSGSMKLMRLNHAQAFVHSLTLQGAITTDYGIGVKIESDGGTVSNCIVRSCEVQGYWSSGAVHATGAKALVTHCVITNNLTASNSAGTDKTAGLHLGNGAVARNCLIANNVEKATGGTCCTGGAYLPNGYIYNCTIADNSARRTGGIRIAKGGVYNCVFAGNLSTTQGAAKNTNDDATKANLFYNCASDDAAAINATCVRDEAASLFANYAQHDYTVGTGSKLIDAGTAEGGVLTEGIDLAGLDRVMGKAVDIGCFEYDSSKFSGGFAVDRSEGIVPVDVVFTGSASGTNGTDVLRYHWDFDGDGTYDVVSDMAEVTYRYLAGGRYTVNLKVENVTAGKFADVVSKPGVLSLVGKTMYVVPENPNAAYPFDTWEKAAATVNAAVNEAQNGIEIVLTNGTHKLPAQLVVAKEVDIHGLTGRPEDVIAQYAGSNEIQPAFKVTTGTALLRDITWEVKAGVRRPGWHLEFGGTLTNCVLRGFMNHDYWASVGAVMASVKGSLVTHCVISNITQTYLGDAPKAIVRSYGGRIENCLIAFNRDAVGGALIVANGPFVNNTVVSNDIAAKSFVLNDWYKDSGGKEHFDGGITNCIFAANSVGGVAGNVFSLRTTNVCRNLSDSEVVWPEGTTNFVRPAEDIFDAKAATPWTISLDAIRAGCRGSRLADASAVDLAGNPRVVGRRVDIGCYQCQEMSGLLIRVR